MLAQLVQSAFRGLNAPIRRHDSRCAHAAGGGGSQGLLLPVPVRISFGSDPNPTFTVDPPRDRIVDANAATCTLLGYTRDELIGRVRLSDVHPDEMPQLLELRAQVYRDGSAHTDELNCLTAD